MELNFELIDSINKSSFRGLEDYEVGSVLFWDINIDNKKQNHSLLRSIARILFSAFTEKYYGDVKESDLCFFYSVDYEGHNYKSWFNQVVGLFDDANLLVASKNRFAFKGEILRNVFHWIKTLESFFDYKTAVFYASALAKHYSDFIDVRRELKRSKPKVITVIDSSHSLDNIVTQWANEQGIKTVTLQHGIESEVDYARYVSSDYILVFGQQTYELYEQNGFAMDRIKIVGMPSLIGQEVLSNYSIGKNAIAVILGAYVSEKDDLKMLSTVCSVSEKTGMKVIAKLHPACSTEDYPPGSFDKVDQVVCTEMNIDELMKVVDFATVTQSTVFVENLINCKPTFVYNCSECNHPYGKSKEILFETEEELEKLIDNAKRDTVGMVNCMKRVLGYYTVVDNIEKQYRDFYSGLLEEVV